MENGGKIEKSEFPQYYALIFCIHKRASVKQKTASGKKRKGRGRMMKIKCLIAFNNTRKMSAAEMNLVQGGVQL